MLISLNPITDGDEFVAPPAQAGGILAAELFKRGDCLPEIGPPFQDAAVLQDQDDVERRLRVLGAAPFELETAISRHSGKAAMAKRMRIVQKAGRRKE